MAIAWGDVVAYYDKCFYQQSRRRTRNAKLLIVNHALFFSDLAVRASGASILPDYDYVVLDEAHTIEQVAGDHFGVSISSSQIRYLLNRLYNHRTNRGLLAGFHADDVIKTVSNTREVMTRFFDCLARWHQERGRQNGRLVDGPPVKNDLTPALHDLHRQLKTLRSEVEEEEDRFEINSNLERVIACADALESVLGREKSDWVYWMDVDCRRGPSIKLNARPIDVSGVLNDSLFRTVSAAVMTSATLCTKPGDDFGYIRSRLGLEDPMQSELGFSV